MFRVTTEVEGKSVTTEIKLKRLAFSHFAQIIDRWDQDVALHKDRIDGRFHVNSRLLVASDADSKPILNGKVSVASTVRYEGRRFHSAVFQSGIATQVDKIPLPDQIMPTMTDPTHTSRDVLFVDSDCKITFNENGSYRCVCEQPLAQETGQILESTLLIMGRKKSRLKVEGVVKGNVVIYSPEKITITGHLKYARNPLTEKESTDFLGLISEKNIEIAGPVQTGRGDLEIQAAMFAKRRFVIRRFDARHQGVLRILGSLSSGSLSASEPRFSTVLIFDKRLEKTRLNYFPETDKYELESWNEKWRIENQSSEEKVLMDNSK